MNRNRIIKVILGVLTVLPVVWFCVLFYQDGYARDYGIYRSRTLLAYGGGFAALLCGFVFLWQLFLQKGNRKGANLQFRFSDSDGCESGAVGE